MAVSKKVQELVKDSVEYGINQGLPEFMLYVVYAQARKMPQNGWAIIGATSKKEAREIAREYWIPTARIVGVITFEDYCRNLDADEEYKRLKNTNKLPKKLREWYELEWGI